MIYLLCIRVFMFSVFLCNLESHLFLFSKRTWKLQAKHFFFCFLLLLVIPSKFLPTSRLELIEHKEFSIPCDLLVLTFQACLYSQVVVIFFLLYYLCQPRISFQQSQSYHDLNIHFLTCTCLEKIQI